MIVRRLFHAGAPAYARGLKNLKNKDRYHWRRSVESKCHFFLSDNAYRLPY